MRAKFASEDQAHIAILDFMERAIPGALIWHTPNGGKRHISVAQKLKLLGVKRGVPDLTMLPPHDNTGKHSVYFLEVKAPAHGRLSPEQVTFRNEAIMRGAGWGMARSVEEAEKQLVAWGFNLKARHKTI